MDKTLFFPIIKRRANYSMKSDGKPYKNYTHYHDEIAQDCAYRCVYCDTIENEIGFEGMVLDHFRPQKHFLELANDPANLVLSCPKCNRLKSDHWPASTGCHDTHDGLCGFIDPFIESRLDYFSINDDGTLVSIKPPAGYIVSILLLNRHSRIQVRYLRILKHKLDSILSDITSEFEVKYAAWTNGEISKDEFNEFCGEFKKKLSLANALSSAN